MQDGRLAAGRRVVDAERAAFSMQRYACVAMALGARRFGDQRNIASDGVVRHADIVDVKAGQAEERVHVSRLEDDG